MTQKTAKKKTGRPRVGQPLSITLTQEQLAWIESQVSKFPGYSRTSFIRAVIHGAMIADRKAGK